MFIVTVELSSYYIVVFANWQTLALINGRCVHVFFLSSRVAQGLIRASVCVCV